MRDRLTKKHGRDLLVSRKYYDRLRENVREIVQDAGLKERHFVEIMYLVDRQVGLTPPLQDEEKFLRFSFVVFFTLRIEINKAVMRSWAARERARLRAAKRAADPVDPTSYQGNDDDGLIQFYNRDTGSAETDVFIAGGNDSLHGAQIVADDLT